MDRRGLVVGEERARLARTLGAHVFAERARRGWTQARLSELSGVGVGLIADLENRRARPSDRTTARLAAAFASDGDDLARAVEGPSVAIHTRRSQPVPDRIARSVRSPDDPRRRGRHLRHLRHLRHHTPVGHGPDSDPDARRCPVDPACGGPSGRSRRRASYRA
ncbi:helix-turn-helix transcriptional regulator [Pseudonocardia sp. ICBG601]|uniref:helix-turn-helix transcriptional regulator n=1 Tax=Pseudonocardia sp. ICBG601 TaxID=2846759 RepID=UPI001CF643CC